MGGVMTEPDASQGFGAPRDLVVDAVRNLHAVRQRSALALLGIVIGTAAVIAMITIGENAKSHALAQFLAMGADLLAIQPDSNPSGRPPPFTPGDVAALRELPGIDAVAPLALAGMELAHDRNRVVASVAGVTGDLFAMARLSVAQGRVLSDFDGGGTFVVLGWTAARQLAGAQKMEAGKTEAGPMDAGGRLTIGDAVRIGGYGYTVVGVLNEVVPNPLLPVDLNSAALIPLPGLRRVAPAAEISSLTIRRKPGADEEALHASVAAHFVGPPRPRPVVVQSARQLIAAMADQMRVHTLLLSAIGAISLVVGGVGVMNVMLMNVVERRREIGLRLALGARPRDIRAMFLIEALVLSVVGGVLGIALGVAAAALYAENAGWRFGLSALAPPLGLGMSVVVGLFFGLYPAVRAARLDPIVALRGD